MPLFGSHLWLLFLCSALALSEADRPFGNMEAKLRDDIFLKRQINPHVRPVMYYNKTLRVKLGVSLRHIIELDETKQLLVSNNFVKMSWTDDALKWDKDQYGGMDTLRVPADLIWKPDITLYNGAESVFGNTMAVVKSSGDVIWVPPARLESHCSMTGMKDFPFDEHECFLKFGSWTYDGFIVDLQIDNKQEFNEMGDKATEWHILSMRTVRTEKYYSCCVEPYPDVTYYVTLKRRAPYYALTLVIPLLFMMTFAMVSFWLPPKAEEKITLGCFNVLFLIIMLSHLHWLVPRSHVYVPRIVIFSGCTLFFAGVSLILGVWTITLSRRRQFTPTPLWFEKLRASKFGKIFCLPSAQMVEEENLLNAQNVDPQDASQDASHNAEAHDDSKAAGTQGTASSACFPRKYREDWLVFTTAMDRFFFYCYCFAFFVILTCSFS